MECNCEKLCEECKREVCPRCDEKSRKRANTISNFLKYTEIFLSGFALCLLMISPKKKEENSNEDEDSNEEKDSNEDE